MILFHGTSSSRAEQIIEDGMIKTDAKLQYNLGLGNDTTTGYIYLTNDICCALNYANLSNSGENSPYVSVFMFEIDDSLLLPDIDEVEYATNEIQKMNDYIDWRNPTVEETLQNTGCVRIDFDIAFENTKTRCAKIPSISNHSSENKEDRKEVIEMIKLYRNKKKDANKRSDFISKHFDKLDFL